MEQLKIRYKNLETALKSLEISVDEFELVKKSQIEDTKDFIRDSVIKRFEFTLDTTWKYLKEYLEKVLGLTLVNKGPKPIFRECLKAGLLTEEETVLAIEMVDSRNLTSHIYKEEVSNFISSKVYGYFQLMKKIIEQTKPDQN